MKDQTYKDVPATPTGEALLNPPTSYVVEHLAIILQNPVDDIESLKSFFSASIMLQIPRLSSLLVERPNGTHYFRSTKVDIDKHFIVRRLIDDETPSIKESDYEDLINDYISDLATSPLMSTDKPLWEIHVLVDARCLVLQIHHAIGDGASVLSMIREIGISSSGHPRKGDGKDKTKVAKPNFRLGNGEEGLLGFLRYVWFSTVFSFDAVVKAFINKDKGTVLNAKAGKVGYPSRSKLVTASFNFDDVKSVKKVIPNATINVCGIIWGGLKKYIDARSSSGDGIAPKEGQQITGALMANVRKVAGLQAASKLLMRSAERVTFGFTNLMGPTEQLSIAGNPVTYLRASLSTTPLGILVVLLSYKKNLDMQIMVDEEVVPDSKFLAACFKHTFQEMMDALN